MLVRQAQAGDYPGLYTVIRAAFVTDAEAKLVEKLRDCEACLLSLVAVEGERVVGHVLFSKVSISHCKKNLLVAGLAPMAVLPEWQNRGIGTELVKE
ncbi:MAG: GNAT family N-acetyltransferase, partial [Gammaproteobacteria bacterium]